MPESLKPYCHWDPSRKICRGRSDLIVCIEVLEHMPADEAEAAIANICGQTADILFSSSPLDFRERRT